MQQDGPVPTNPSLAADTAAWLSSVLGAPARTVRTLRRARGEVHFIEVDGRSPVVAKVAHARPVEGPAEGPVGAGARPSLAPPVPPGDHLRLQVEATVVLHERLSGRAGLRAPGLIATRSEPPTLVVELLAPATPLSEMLLRAATVPTPRLRRTTIATAAGAGRAIRAVAGPGPLEERTTRHAGPASLAAAAQRLGRHLAPLHPALVDRAVRRVEEQLSEVGDWPLAPGHGDFAPRNVLVLTDATGVIDPLFAHNVPVLEDPARFVVNVLATLGELPLPTGRPARLGQDVVDAFLDECGLQLADPAFNAVCTTIALDRWAAIVSRGPSRPAVRLRRITGSRAMPRLLRQLWSPA